MSQPSHLLAAGRACVRVPPAGGLKTPGLLRSIRQSGGPRGRLAGGEARYPPDPFICSPSLSCSLAFLFSRSREHRHFFRLHHVTRKQAPRGSFYLFNLIIFFYLLILFFYTLLVRQGGNTGCPAAARVLIPKINPVKWNPALSRRPRCPADDRGEPPVAGQGNARARR